MLFNSPLFLFTFLPAFLVMYLIAGRRLRNLILLLGSWLFYVWGEPSRFPLLFISIGMNYVFGLWIARRQAREQNPRGVVWLAVAANLGMLALFKYSYFLATNVNFLLSPVGITLPASILEILKDQTTRLPLGISFFTFQALSYVLDVYRKANPAERNLYRLALYLSMFPQLISGPLVRFRELNKQFDNRQVALSDLAEGARRFIFGLSKKVLIAGTLERMVNSIGQFSVLSYAPSVAWLGMFAFTLQIYYDFSGYSDMAIGVARMLGYRLPENFNYPYISQSITEFWRRWHITLSNWFRDYVYFPLERSHRKTTLDRYINILIVFLLTGLWHGASWSFVLWGLAQGVFIVFERTPAGAWLNRLWRPIRHVYALMAILFSWLIFRSISIQSIYIYLKVMLGLVPGQAVVYPRMFLTPEVIIALLVGILFSLPVYPFLLSLRQRLQDNAARAKLWPGVMDGVSTGVAILLLALTMVYLANSTINAFIYFRF